MGMKLRKRRAKIAKRVAAYEKVMDDRSVSDDVKRSLHKPGSHKK